MDSSLQLDNKGEALTHLHTGRSSPAQQRQLKSWIAPKANTTSYAAAAAAAVTLRSSCWRTALTPSLAQTMAASRCWLLLQLASRK
jgi:hypothetical protein